MSAPPSSPSNHAQLPVTICEMALRDGMQVLNHRLQIPLEERLELAIAIEAAGLPYVEVGSFVSHKIMPSMQDTPYFLDRLPGSPDRRAVLIPTLRQYERARDTGGFGIVALLASASDSYSQLNTRMSYQQALDASCRVGAAAGRDGFRLRAYLSYAFREMHGNGGAEQPIEHLVSICRQLLEAGCESIALSDTDGRATPGDIERVTSGLGTELGFDSLGVHLHDRYGLGLLNAYVAYQAGIRTFDASLGGVGGNPKIAYAVGNLATEELVLLFDRLGVSTGIDSQLVLEAALKVAKMIEQTGAPPTTSKVLLNALARQESGASG